jgi:hypothetical protein
MAVVEVQSEVSEGQAERVRCRRTDRVGRRSPEWVRGDGEGRAVCIAEYWRVEEDEETGERTVLWSTIDAIEELEPEQAWDGQWIPLIPPSAGS